jgi:hypothetical protein
MPRRDDRVVFAEAGESSFLLDPASGDYFSLSEVGARIWNLCDGRQTLDSIAGRLAEEYDAPLETIVADVAELLDELNAAGLLAST